jgi:hypothetical protein
MSSTIPLPPREQLYNRRSLRLVCGGQTSPHCQILGSSYFIAPPRAQLSIRYCSNKQQPSLVGQAKHSPPWVGSRSPMDWWFGLAPATTLEFWVRFRNERNQGKQTHSVLKYSTIPLPPREQLCNRYCSNKHTHTNVPCLRMRERERERELY